MILAEYIFYEVDNSIYIAIAVTQKLVDDRFKEKLNFLAENDKWSYNRGTSKKVPADWLAWVRSKQAIDYRVDKEE